MARRKIDKAALASLIRDLKELSNEQKADLLQLLNEQKRYGLVWEEHKEEAQEVLSESIPVLVEDKSKAIIAFDDCRAKISEPTLTPNHILIEGDNLHALTALTYTHEGKVDVIYIDPPYNTGNKDFVYNDSFVDSEDGYRHSKWLSFMEKRLRIAKKLLSDRGVIFISIDDNEQANLKLLCDEVFGEYNQVASIVWQKIHSIKNDARYFSQSHEYVLVYAKSKDDVRLNLLPRTESMNSRYVNKDNDPRGPWQSGDLVASGERSNGHYIVKSPKTGKEFDVPSGKHWVYTEDNLNELIRTNSIWFGESGNSFPRKKRFLSDVQAGRIPNTLWLSEEIGNNQTATREIIDIFGVRGIFDFPKPLAYIKQMIHLGSMGDSTILDFFAGSGTTLHATMQLNAEDGGHRKCILVTNNENNICEDVTYERNKRVINGYTTPKGVEVAGLTNNNLRYYKVEFTERENCSANRQKLMQMATDMLCIKHDLYDEEKQFGSLKFKPRYAIYFANAEKQMLVVYEPRAIEYIAKELRENSTLATRECKLIIYAYSDGAYAYNDEFEGLEDRVELIAMPDALNQAIRSILPPQKEDNFTIEEGGEE